MISKVTDWKPGIYDWVIIGVCLVVGTLVLTVVTNSPSSEVDTAPLSQVSVDIQVPTALPAPTSLPVLPHFTAGHLYWLCEGEIGSSQNFVNLMFSGPAPCELEGSRVMVTGEVLPPSSATSTNVTLAVERYAGATQADGTEMYFALPGLILQGIDAESRASLEGGQEITAACVVGQSVFGMLAGTSRLLTDCELGDALPLESN